MNEIIDFELIKRKYAEIKQRYKYYYPIKVNDNPDIINALNKLGSGFLVANYDKAVSLVDDFGVPAENILYIVSFTNDSDVANLLEKGIRFFIVDSYNKINVLSKSDKQINVLLRVSVPLQELDRFGVDIDKTDEYISAIKDAGLNFCGLHFHIPSQRNSLEIDKLMIKKIVEKYPDLQCLDIGGGCSVENSKELYEYIMSISNAKIVICEIGYDFVNDAINIETEVIEVKSINGINIASIDVGIYSGLMDLFLTKRSFSIVSQDNDENKVLYRLYGPSLDCRDYIGEYLLPTLHVGDKLIVKNSGAYVRTLLTTF